MYSEIGRPSIAPEKLLRALLLQILYTVRSERMLMEELEYNLLFRWFVGLDMDEAVWVLTAFTKNRDRLLEGDIAERFFALILEQKTGPRILLPVEPPIIGMSLGTLGYLLPRGTLPPVTRYAVAGLIFNALPLALAVVLIALGRMH